MRSVDEKLRRADEMMRSVGQKMWSRVLKTVDVISASGTIR